MRALFYVLNAFRAISISSLACVVAMAVAIMVGASGVQDKHIFYVVSQGFYIIMATALFLSEADMCSSYFDRHIPGLGSAGNPLVLASCQAFLSLSVLQYLDTRFLRMAALRNLAIATGTLLGASAILNMLTALVLGSRTRFVRSNKNAAGSNAAPPPAAAAGAPPPPPMLPAYPGRGGKSLDISSPLPPPTFRPTF